jgi:beta-glucosidase
MAEEFKGKGANIALAPGIGIARVPTAGRNFEYLCGEDPILGAVLVKQVIRGLQGEGIIANAKHWVNNEIETDRKRVSANVSERVRFELYYPPFKAAVDAGVLSVMCAYNRINDVWACENKDTLSHLKSNMGFDGWVSYTCRHFYVSLLIKSWDLFLWSTWLAYYR